jgi:dephospho-CoA kinase
MQNKKNSKKMLIGVTGGIGSGKTQVCRNLNKFGYKIFYADDVARSLYASNAKLKDKIVRAFGKKILDGKGSISTPEFRKIVFANDENQKKVNRVVHPFVIEEILRQARSSKPSLIFIEAALIFESGFDKYLDYTVEVFAPENKRIEWVARRNNLERQVIKSIIELQMPESEKVKKADFVIKNNTSKQNLKIKVRYLMGILKKLPGSQTNHN